MDVGSWLNSLGLGQYEATFRENDVSAEILRDLTAEDLDGLGVTSIGHRRQLLVAIAKLRDDNDAPPPAVSPTDDRPSVDLCGRTPPTHRDVLRPGGFDGAE